MSASVWRQQGLSLNDRQILRYLGFRGTTPDGLLPISPSCRSEEQRDEESSPAGEGKILRFAQNDRAEVNALSARISQVKSALEAGNYRVCWLRLPVETEGSTLRFSDVLTVHSAALAQNLSGCREAVLFCATLGSAVDQAILSNRLRPASAAVWDAAGTAGIEQLCDDFCSTLPTPQRSRFSPGYGDLPLETQRPILELLDAQRLLGVTLTDSLLMTPCKSVTAFVGLLRP